MADFTPLANSVEEALSLFSYTSLRNGQGEAIQDVLDNKDSLVVMPTGSGKSLCFQIPSCLFDGLTIVVSPLIALMKDQVDALQRKDIPATFINSSLSGDEQNERITAMQSGAYRIVYVAPERFRSTRFTYALQDIPIRLLAIDEAHCISEWGHDFRTDYRKLKQIRIDLGSPTTIALTATATPEVQRDIIDALGLEDPQIHIRGFERDNLFFEVAQVRTKKEKFDRIVALIQHYKSQSFVIYCATRKQCEEVVADLKRRRIKAGMYHGGLADGARRKEQESWIQDKTPILVATNAFGMGVDKSNVRGVIHFNIPGSLEAYYQEAGRAGRDGIDASCLLLFSLADRGIHEFFIENTHPSKVLFEKIWRYVSKLGKGTHAVDLKLMAKTFSTDKQQVHVMGLESALRSLQFMGYIEYLKQGRLESISVYDISKGLELDWTAINQRRSIAKRQLKNILDYSTSAQCRQLHIVKYFGGRPSFSKGCGKCDRCIGIPDYAKVSMEQNAKKIPSGGEDGVRIMRKVLAGIARAKGRRGAHAVAGMLVGSQAKAVQKAGLQSLSTFGILKQMKKDDAVYLLDLCTKFAWAKRNEHGCVLISPLGMDIMKEEDLPTESELAFLELTFVSRRSQTSSRSSSSDSFSGTGGTYAETLRLHKTGIGYKEIAKSRELTVQTILSHFQKLTLAGETIDVSRDIDGTLLEKIRAVSMKWKPGDREKPLIEALDGACTYNALRLHLIPILKERVESS